MPEVAIQGETIIVSPIQNLATMHRSLQEMDKQIAAAEEGLDEEAKDAIQEAVSLIEAYDIESGSRGAHQMTIAILKNLETRSISAMKGKRASLAVEYEEELSRIAPSLPYGEDKFLKALKKKGESFREGKIKIMRTARTTRTVLTEKFIETFPHILKSCCKVELTKADALVGKKTMDAFVEKTTTYRYELVDMEIEEYGGA